MQIHTFPVCLLIVLNGIEINVNFSCFKADPLLIVLNGIEILLILLLLRPVMLLIVLNGIEIE